MWDQAFWPLNFSDHLARIRRDVLVQIELVVGRADERFGQINGVVHNRDDGQKVAVTYPMLCDRCQVTTRYAVATDVPFLEMGDCNRQHVTFPLAGRKAAPTMERIRRGMRPSVQINRIVDRAEPLRVERRDLPCKRILFLPDCQLRGPAPDVVGRMRTTLPFRQRLDRRVPTVGTESPRIADGKTEVVTELWARDPLRLIFMESWGPLARKINLSGRTHRQTDGGRQE